MSQPPHATLTDALSAYQGNSGAGVKTPPLDKWQPTETVPFDIVIDSEGNWLHEGQKMTRQSLVNLFASVLWGEKDATGETHYYLKTPTHLYEICVKDAPLFITTVERTLKDGVSYLQFHTHTGQSVLLDDTHTPYFHARPNADGTADNYALYLPMPHSLTAKISRNVFYHLINEGELHEHQGEVTLTLESGGRTYTLSYPA